MEISIGSYKFRGIILLLIVVVLWILFGHLLCSCCTMTLSEGLETMGVTSALPKEMQKKIKKASNIVTEDVKKVTEGFVGYNNKAYGPEFASSKNDGVIMPTSTWSMPTLEYSPGTTPDTGIKEIWDRPQQQIPLPDGQLDMFAKTPFKPECCPNAYSSSTGCACMTVDQYNYLRSRGSNNVPYSEY